MAMRSIPALFQPLLAVGSALVGAPVSGQVPLDLSLDRRAVADSTLPWGWQFVSYLQAGYEVGIRSEADSAGRASPVLRIRAAGELQEVTAVYRIPEEVGAGRSLGFSAVVGVPRRETRLRIGLVARRIVDGEFVIVAADTLASPDTFPFHGELRAVISVPPEADMVDLWITRGGAGETALRDPRLTVDGRPAARAIDPIAVPRTEVEWVREHALDWGEESSLGASRRFPGLERLVGNARVLMLGESTHGTREFFQLKHRVIEELARSGGGPLLVAIEDHLTAVHGLDRYVAGGEIDLDAALREMFGVYNREEFVSFIETVRKLNASGHRIELWGVDMQNPIPAIRQLLELLAALDPDLASEVEGRYVPIREGWGAGGPVQQDYAVWKKTALEVERRLRLRAAPGDGPQERVGRRALALRLARLVSQAIELREAGNPDLRDAFMAENLLWILERRPARRLVFWGHNGHVRLSAGGMGAHVKARLGGEALSVALLTFQGEYTAYWPRNGRWRADTFALFPGPQRSAEYLLHTAGLRLAALDLRVVPRTGTGSRLPGELQMRSIGAVPLDYGFAPLRPADTFDLLFFVDRTSATRPTTSASR